MSCSHILPCLNFLQVWDIVDLICVRNYIAAHTKPIYGVSVRPNSDSSFVTGSLDYYVSLWDENISKPVLGNY